MVDFNDPWILTGRTGNAVPLATDRLKTKAPWLILLLVVVLLLAGVGALSAHAVLRAEVEAVRLADPVAEAPTSLTLRVATATRFQTIAGTGAAFSEVGWRALQSLPEAKRSAVLSRLFSLDNGGAGFSFCRLPVGANDFALDAYSLNDTTGDYAMTKFSIARDETGLIAFIKAARAVNPALRLQASPWTPPGWLKTNGALTGGGAHLRAVPQVYQAYALYLRKFLEAYEAQGLRVDRLLIQNEPDLAGDYPTCLISAEEFVNFTVNYLAPELRRAGLEDRLWAGTFRTAGEIYSHLCMADAAFRQAVRGVGFQYAHPERIAELSRLYPGTAVMHTESVCHDGKNLPVQGVKLVEDLLGYVGAGCDVFSYWNMVLDEERKSSWGWGQNSLVVVNRPTGGVIYNPDFEVMRLASRAMRPGAVRVAASGGALAPLAFAQPDGSVTLLAWNPGPEREATVELDGEAVTVRLAGGSFSAIRLSRVSAIRAALMKWYH